MLHFTLFVWENLTSVSERCMYLYKSSGHSLQKKIFAKVKGLSLWKVGWGRAGSGRVGAGSGRVGSGPTFFYFFLFLFFDFFFFF